ncbi:MAG: hypothetical protein JW820_06155 [Spirochaetales bacterium]|nr:hypothetical protein [Spirochaetales bacterium]
MQKKKYVRPTLKTWGTVQELTQLGIVEYNDQWGNGRPCCRGSQPRQYRPG